jgi:hypothetical protein
VAAVYGGGTSGGGCIVSQGGGSLTYYMHYFLRIFCSLSLKLIIMDILVFSC